MTEPKSIQPERRDVQSVTSEESKATNALSKETFQNPEEFLRILRNDVCNIGSLPGCQMTKNDLIVYSQTTGGDQQGKAAAKIAASHFNQLRGHDSVIDPAELDLTLKLYRGDIRGMIREQQIKRGFTAALTGVVVTPSLGVATVASAELPPMSYAMGCMTVMSAAAAVRLTYSAWSASSEITTKARQTQEFLQSWPEINQKKR